MKIIRKSPLSGEVNTLDLDITEQQLTRWKAGAYIQDVAPHLSADDREFIISGITPKEWNETFNIR